MDIVLMGPPGVGKGTQAAMLAVRTGLTHLASGDLFRLNIRDETELGLLAKAFVDRGELVPDRIVIEMVLDRMLGPDGVSGALLDGFPRTLAQAEMLETIGRPIDAVLVLEVDEQEAVARMAKRAQEEGRTDDTPEAIRTRLANYRENTAPLIEWYRARDKVVPVNGLGTIDEVFAQIRKALDHMGARA